MWRALVLAVLGSWSANAEAQADRAPVTVVLVDVAEGGDPFVARLSVELVELGLNARVMPGSVGVSLQEIARGQGGRAAVRPREDGRGVEIFVDERASGRPMLRHLVVDDGPGPPDVALVVLQTGEFLRAAFFGPKPAPPPVVRGTAPAVEPVDAPTGHLGAGFGAFAQAGGLGVVPMLGLEIAYLPWLTAAGRVRLGFEGFANLPLSDADVQSFEGRTAGSARLFGAGLRGQHEWGRARFEASLGGAALWWTLAGEAAPGLNGAERTLWSAVAYGRLRLLYALATTVAVGIDGLFAWSGATADIVHAERAIARLGHALATGLFVVEVRAL